MMSALGNFSCPRPERLSEAVSMGADEALREHMARCDACQAEWQAQVGILGLIRRIEVPPPADARVEALRTALLSQARGPGAGGRPYRPAWYRASPARTGLALAAGVLILIGAAAAIAWIWRRPPTRPAAPPVRMEGQGPGARQAPRQREEVAASPAGMEEPPPGPMGPGVGPAPVEAEDRAPAGPRPVRKHTRRPASPSRSTAEVGEGPGATEAGTVQEVPPAPPAAPAAPPAAPAAPPAAPAAPPAARVASPEERLLSAGLQELKAGAFKAAAGTFGRMEQVAGDGPFAEDASFWLGVAQARAGQRKEAVASLRRFLSRHGRSPRRWEAASILGYQLLAAGELDEAERRFAEAALAPSGEIRQSAHAGLAAVRERRGR
jgi:hypothetical protein